MRHKLNKEESAKHNRFSRWYTCLLFPGFSSDDWFVDSGASNHMCGNEKFFDKLHSTDESTVILADGEKLTTNKLGNVKLSITSGGGHQMGSEASGMDVAINNVLYVPDIKGNLISVRKLILSGFDVLFKGDECMLVKENDSLTIAKFENGLYKVLTASKQEKLMTVQQENLIHCIHEWHLIMAHRNLHDIRKMECQVLKIKSCVF